MVYELIISEKPQAAKKIADALADKGSLKKHREYNVNYFALTHKGKQIRIASAVGHLYILGEKGGESWKYPVFDTEWKPLAKVNKEAKYTNDYIRLLTKLGKDANELTVAADFDVEGEVIGLNVVRFACGKKDANRMKFSTLTKDALIKSYENKLPTLEWGQAKAGETRHHLDWIYGINLSRAFTESIKKGTNQFKVLSSGRVQAPSLHFLANRERKIAAFNPETFWEIYLDGNCSGVDVEAQYELPQDKIKERKADLEEQAENADENEEIKTTVDKLKIFDEDWKNKVLEDTKGKDGYISDIQARQFKQAVPTPFDLTSLQMEANNMFGFTPKRTLELAQKLYIEGITSYPRTSSQKLPKDLEFKKILDKLISQPNFRDKVKRVLEINPSLKPNEGKKEDAAHPAIHPTGETPKKLESQEAKLYDLICKRFFAVFGKPATRETNTIRVDIEKHEFILKGTRTIDKGWHELYEPYLKFEEVQLPKLEKGVEVKNKEIKEMKKETSPPKRYTQASIIKELEKRNLGTKATRAAILENLYSRGYVIDRSIKVTELGLKMDEVLSEEMPIIVDEELTRHFEHEMKKIREQKSTPDKVLEKAEKELLKVLEDVKKHEKELGIKLAGANHEATVKLNTVGKCPNCEKGTLMIRRARKTGQKFVGCDGYPECKTIFNIPHTPIVQGGDGLKCPECNFPMILAGKSDGNLRKVCINPECITRQEKDENGNVITGKKYEEEGMLCPNCKEGHMVLRKSFYGSFLGCDNYPKCKTMMKIVKGKVDTTPIVPAAKKKTAKKATKKAVKKVTKKVAKKK